MSRVVGVIVEYNPLHNGHAYHLAASKEAAGASAVVAVMSGHWLQRGEPALMNKWARAEAALLAGVDLVLELPVAYSAQPAEWFAYGAVSCLARTGVVDAFCFGSESGDVDALRSLAERLAAEPESFAGLLQAELKSGAPYPAAYAAAAAALTGSLDAARALAEPNNSLGFHYLLARERLGADLEPLTIRRVKAGYHDAGFADASIASATAIRKRLLDADGDRAAALAAIEPYAPAATLRILSREWDAGRAPMHWERYRTPLFHRLLTMPEERLAAVREIVEGLEGRIKKTLPTLGPEASVEALLDALKTKRYTRTKLQRMLAAVYLEHAKDATSGAALRGGAPYLRVLGFTEAGRALLSRMKREAGAPVVTNVGAAEPHPLLALDAAATAAYALGYETSGPDDWFADYYKPPIRVGFSGSDAK
ncbi:nucleotidyltransferase [Paenibacillus antri]|uniref:tRNA(Met) cytidine acetate ligase n=1 Tax=Paenibacillus antri TaxID=2582848 RepID=A0A5R9G0Q1_9BACL|nr:nucleotidyltransferase [Paenibacillus antri]TLS49897.1 nucleotidyltransferase [Paenibacillus antri]